ncbi:phosphatase PAP2 family protein [Kyrpidia spormannii]|uniref:Phosphatase PAP2 family protein n=2 Tax=Kyrpidia spormannii TaxID=2055160 RepID=A0ACA8Z831_9BACL|nr:phosphatase PAP2 family protein [Kyrpidia spormannii]CAB3390729.1 Phosphatase PAP2 family protein [Kyrpidia spormannii]CAB3391642.1 Phosphatase PAP2 family protein [Kyrpidia spormannii]
MNTFDVALFHIVNSQAGHHTWLDGLMSSVAQYSVEIYAIAFIALWLLLPKREEGPRHALVVAVFAGILALLVNLVISHIWFRPRPFTVLAAGTFTELIPHAPDASFPSDHASGSFALASATWGKINRWVAAGLTALAVLTMIARVYTGVHWPTDVLAGMVIGVFAGRVIWKIGAPILSLTRIGLRMFHFGRYARG